LLKRKLRKTQILKLPLKPKKRRMKLLIKQQQTVLPVPKLNQLKPPSCQKFSLHGHQLNNLLLFQLKLKVDSKI